MNIQKNWYRILGLFLIVVLVYWGVNNLTGIQQLGSAVTSAALPFIIGVALAFILNIPVKILEKLLVKWTGKYRSWYRILSIILSFLLVILIIMFLIFLVIPDLQQTFSSFIETVPQEIDQFVTYISDFINNHPEIVGYVNELDIDVNSLQRTLVNSIQTALTSILGGLFGVVSMAVSSVVTVFIAIVFSIYVLVMKEALIRQMKKIIYAIADLRWANYITNVGRKANEIFSSFVGGQIMEAFILGILVYLGMWMFDFPYRLSVSVITGTMALIPIYGAIIGGVLGFILIAVISFPKAIWFIIFIVVIQQLEGNIIYPRVVGNSVGLPGIWVMFSVTIGGAFFGLVGMLISVPVVSLVYTLFSATINYKLAERGLNINHDTNSIKPHERHYKSTKELHEVAQSTMKSK